jgi:hypothetical protein
MRNRPHSHILNGWFDAPRSKALEERLKATLVAFGCDPKVFTYSQPVRVRVYGGIRGRPA